MYEYIIAPILQELDRDTKNSKSLFSLESRLKTVHKEES